MMNFVIELFFVCALSNCVFGYLELESYDKPNAFDLDLYENALDPELCQSDLAYLQSNTYLGAQFLDAGIRLPRGFLIGNLADLGNYHQCLSIRGEDDYDHIRGKYCSITVPLSQENIQWQWIPDVLAKNDLPWGKLFPNVTHVSENWLRKLKDFQNRESSLRRFLWQKTDSGEHKRLPPDSPMGDLSLNLAICIPKSCTTGEALDSFFSNITTSGLDYTENYCRLPNDKPFVAADYVAFTVFGLVGLLTIISTSYDVHHTVIQKKDPKLASPLYTSFSVFTNCRRLFSYSSTPKTIECLDGLRSIAMTWVVLGHSFSTNLIGGVVNPLDTLEWVKQPYSIYVTSAPITVDTFLLLSGILLVYTVAGKMGRETLLKNIHLFYLNRLLRLFPILATAVLATASVFHHVADGPQWQLFVRKVYNCRTYWWSTLLHVQNYMNASYMCLGHTWYIAVDVQLHIISPLVLYWVLTSKRAAWYGLTAALATSLTAATIFNAAWGFKSSAIQASIENDLNYNRYYYINTLCRAPPFFVGMIYGYLLYSLQDTQIRIKRPILLLTWSLWFGVVSTVLYLTYPMQQAEWEHPVLDVFINSFMRPVWGLAIGWMIFACAKGYGGPINWFLSLRAWKAPSRLSYAAYVLHYPLLFVVNCTALAPVYFSDEPFIFKFFADFTVAAIASLIATILIDAPCSTLIKIAMGAGSKRPIKAPMENNAEEHSLLLYSCIILNINAEKTKDRSSAFDLDLYEQVLDSELCQKELQYISGNPLLQATFLDAGIRVPKGLLTFNTVELGNYYQCLGIKEPTPDSIIEGKHCSISIPLGQQLDIPWETIPSHLSPRLDPWRELVTNTSLFTEDYIEKINKFHAERSKIENVIDGAVGDRSLPSDNLLSDLTLSVSICVPKSCTTKEALDGYYFNIVSSAGLRYTENYCRLPNDKPYAAADYVAFAVFGAIGLLTIISTIYDINSTIIQKRDKKQISKLYQSFSVYTNCRRLVTVSKNPKSIECLDGIRVLAMAWVILGHTYITSPPVINVVDIATWFASGHSVFITGAVITVDTFFFLSGLLIAYTTAGKIGPSTLIKNIHLFYLNRLLRMFPILASGVLLMASWFNQVADGPNWQSVVRSVDNCRTYWWSTLLHVQNYINPERVCLDQSWYLSVDIQLHMLCPIVLFWVLSDRRSAWLSLVVALMASLTAATTYNAINGFRTFEHPEAPSYHRYYYINTLTRASPFFVGMIFGYVIHISRQRRIQIKKNVNILLWTLWLALMSTCIYVHFPTQQSEWDNPIVDIVLNSFWRPAWAVGVGWMIFACDQGYGGPLNWLLSLQMWKVPARVSYAMYIYHMQIQQVSSGAALAPIFFSDTFFFVRFITDFSMALWVAFLGVLLIDAPCTTLIKMGLDKFGKASKPHSSNKDLNNNANNEGTNDKSLHPSPRCSMDKRDENKNY
ncbi:uncharacterized protein LOC105382199 [Plutella xylostella]|uniref:uncharacterized protein LOC105382199 n=1 Tax=Plutella xylostella TaxID=51655 RepID=UPI00203219CF|nr:uncharacterized protein LOC105382199 [Plutella xylostella]